MKPLKNGIFGEGIFFEELFFKMPSRRRGINAHMYAILVAMLYFIHGVMLAATEPLRWFGIIEIVFALAMTAVSTVLLKRLREQHA